jgi:NADH-quinone oxidoreductase subunit E
MTQDTTTPELRSFEQVCEILDRHDRRPDKLIPILQQVQEVYRYLPEDVLAYVATSLGLPPAKVFGVATFYAHFTLSPRGKYVVRLCDGTACHVRGSNGILEALYDRLGLSEDKHTTDDMLFTVETVSCLGACGLAPVVLINEDVHGQVTPEAAVRLIDEIIQQETGHDEEN